MSAMPALFSKADAMLVSLKPDDIISLTIPAKLHTYLAAGRPVLGSIDGEAARVIAASEAGFVSRAGDAEGLAANVARMQRMSLEERRRMGESGRAYYLRHFDRERCLDLMEASIIRVANPAPGRASSTRTDR
jgi:glycosyltransferase involved in cell wall biosynthesis